MISFTKIPVNISLLTEIGKEFIMSIISMSGSLIYDIFKTKTETANQRKAT
jgi:hypothetical protein